jgi:hypothetical protein
MRFTDLSRAKRRKIVNNIRTLIAQSVSNVEEIPTLLKYVFNKNFDYGLHKKAKINAEQSAIISNLQQSLKQIANKEHQSGTFRAIVLATMGRNIQKQRLAYHLKISRNSVTRVMFMYFCN